MSTLFDLQFLIFYHLMQILKIENFCTSTIWTDHGQSYRRLTFERFKILYLMLCNENERVNSDLSLLFIEEMELYTQEKIRH